MRHNRFGTCLLAVSLGTAGMGSFATVVAAQGAPSAALQEGHGWDDVPPGFRDAQRKGFHDGIEGAKKDFDNHRRPDVNNRDEYRHPHVPAADREDYRDGFRRGYEVAMNHMTGEGPR
jgi:hypothetical protein